MYYAYAYIYAYEYIYAYAYIYAFIYETCMKKNYYLKSYGQIFLCIQVVVVTYWEIINIEDLFSENNF